MKKTLLTLAVATMAVTAFAEDTTTTFADIADTWIRENNTGWGSGWNQNKLELQRIAADESFVHFAGLMAFDYACPEGSKVKEAKLIFVTERVKGNDVSIRAYGNDFDEKTNWGKETDYLAEALAADPIITFTAAGQKTKAITDGLNDSYKNVDAWTNTLDITNYMKSLPMSATRVNFLLTQDEEKVGAQVCFFSKEATEQNATDINTKLSANITVEDLYPRLIVTFEEDKDVVTNVFGSAGDTFIRRGNGNNYGGTNTMEIHNQGDTEFYGLMRFENLPVELNSEDYELKSAVLRLTTERTKDNNRGVSFYEYSNDFAENTKFADEETYVREALANDPIVTFDVNGQFYKALGSDAVGDDFKDVTKWHNYIDLTDYLAGKADATKFNILIKKNSENGNAIKFFTKEATDVALPEATRATNVALNAEDLKPQLTIIYAKKAGSDIGTGVEEIFGDEDAPVEYFNLQGIKVANPEKGLYIKRQREKTTKVIF